jgi:hypothetical protein
MQQAPSSVTTPINRVVQQTVEKIQQVEGKTTVQTVVVKEEDLVVDAIAKNKSAIFTISKVGFDAEFNPIEVSAGRAFAISKDGIVVADGSLAGQKEKYFLKNDSGKFKGELIGADSTGIAFIKIGEAVNGTDQLSFSVPDMGDLSKMKTGQKIIILGSSVQSEIFEGLNDKGNIDLIVSKPNGGAMVLNLDGEALGVALSGANTFVSLKTTLDTLPTYVK